MKKNKKYPTWVCSDCALKAGGKVKEGQISCYHADICDVCGKEKIVTEPRDYGYPDFGSTNESGCVTKSSGSEISTNTSTELTTEAEYFSLCHRCEHRVRWYETKGKHQPRCECSGGPFNIQENSNQKWEFPQAVMNCYMYQPIRPLIIVPAKKEKRPITLNYFSGRIQAVGVVDGGIKTKKHKKGLIYYWKKSKKGKNHD